jgi:hypothetical protein
VLFLRLQVMLDRGVRIEDERLGIYDSIVDMHFKYVGFLLQ